MSASTMKCIFAATVPARFAKGTGRKEDLSMPPKRNWSKLGRSETMRSKYAGRMATARASTPSITCARFAHAANVARRKPDACLRAILFQWRSADPQEVQVNPLTEASAIMLDGAKNPRMGNAEVLASVRRRPVDLAYRRCPRRDVGQVIGVGAPTRTRRKAI